MRSLDDMMLIRTQTFTPKTCTLRRVALRSAALVLVGMLLACDTRRANDVPEPGSAVSLPIALANTIEHSIVPAVIGFDTGAIALDAAADDFCAAIDADHLDTLQQRWRELSLAWNRLAMYNLGPLDNDIIFPAIIFIESMRQRGDDYTDTVRAEITARLGDMTVLDQQYFDNLTFSRVGVLALEVLVFEDSLGVHSTDAADIIADYQSNTRKCELLTGIAGLLRTRANTIAAGWTQNFNGSGKAFRDILQAGELADGAESVPAVIAAVQLHLDYLKTRKLELVLDAKIADYFYQNMLAMLDEIEALLEGSADNSYSLFDHMAGNGELAAIDLVRSNITTARSAALAADRSALGDALGVLDGNFKREIPQGLNVKLGITFSDGD